MNWQVKYAIENLRSQNTSTIDFLHGDFIKITTRDKPDIVAAISADETIDKDIVKFYKKQNHEIDFICGYRKNCVWEGPAITYLREERIGWGSFGTLASAVLEGNANTASHKEFRFADRLLQQYGAVLRLVREFDRVYSIYLKRGGTLRIGMIADYEPTADAVRSMWARFGALDVVWNINPNGNPSQAAIDAGHELGCEVMKWDELKEYMKRT